MERRTPPSQRQTSDLRYAAPFTKTTRNDWTTEAATQLKAWAAHRRRGAWSFQYSWILSVEIWYRHSTLAEEAKGGSSYPPGSEAISYPPIPFFAVPMYH